MSAVQFTGFLLIFAISLFAAPSTYDVQKLPDGFEPTIDGNLSDWTGNPAYFIDSIRSDTNVIAEYPISQPWRRSDFQYYLYAAWNDRKIFFAAKVVADDVLNNCHSGASYCDNIKITQLGKGTAMYIMADGTLKPNPSCIWTNGITFGSAVSLSAQASLPTYEFWLDKETTAPYGATLFTLYPGVVDIDDTTTCIWGSGTCHDETDVCVGAAGPANKQDAWFGSSWENAVYWPTFKLVSTPPKQTHVFWYKCIQNNYALQDSPGPNLPASIIRHEGMIVSAVERPASGITSVPTFYFSRNGVGGPCWSCVFWSNDLNISTGSCSRALLRAEYRDGWGTNNALCNAGPIKFRYGIVTFAGNIVGHGSTSVIPETATWADGLYPLYCTMGYDYSTSLLEQEDSLVFQMPAGRTSSTSPSVLDKRFFEFDVTRQVNWILSHTQPVNKETISYALVLIAPDQIATAGTFYAYSAEDRILPAIGSDAPWTRDGNTMHLVVESDNLQFVSAETNQLSTPLPGLVQIHPNPFKGSVTIEFNAISGPNSDLSIYTLDGKKVFTTAIDGTGAIVWSPKKVASGIYICRMLSGNAVFSKTLLLSR